MDYPKNPPSTQSNHLNEAHLEFVKARAQRQNYRAEEKLRSIEELADVIFLARKNYRKSKNSGT
jgi:hypothetical protein